MSTKIITVLASPPAESAGADYYKGAPLNATEFDQNIINLRAAVDRKAPLAGPGSSQAFSVGALSAASGTFSDNVGIGGSPSAWGGGKTVDVGSYGSYAQRSAGNMELCVSWNSYIDSGNSIGTGCKYKHTGDVASMYTQNGQHQWFVAPSGTAGNAITWTTAMTLNSSGKLLVGGTSGINNERFHVYAGSNMQAITARLTTDGNSYFQGFNAAGSCTVQIMGNGNIQNTNNSYGALSDAKLKDGIIDASSQWDDIKNIQIRKFYLKSDLNKTMQMGVVAQELEQVSPGLVDETPDYEIVKTTDEDGNEKEERVATGTTTKSVKYSILYMKAVKALQEAMTRIEALESKVQALETA